jgi:hypothetical protein
MAVRRRFSGCVRLLLQVAQPPWFRSCLALFPRVTWFRSVVVV